VPPTSIEIGLLEIARRIVLAALGGTATLVGGVLVERAIFQAQLATATQQLVSAYQSAHQIELADERLTMSANMAAATGEQRWIDRYQATLPVIDEAIQKASELAPPAIAERFNAETRVSNSRLVELERAAIDSVRSGDTQGARNILDGALYLYHKQILSDGTGKFFDGMIAAVRRDFSIVESRALAAIAAGIALVIVGAVVFWRRLSAALERFEGAYREAEKKIKNLAMTDVLTGLANRLSLRESLQAALRRAGQDQTKVAVLMIDLDRFKPLNDRHGHLVGDRILKTVAQRMAKIVRNGAFRGRYGGDQFLAVVEYSTDEESPHRVGQRLVEALSEHMTIDGLTVQIGASVGCAVYPTDAKSDEELIRKADMALYRAKQEARGTVRSYDSNMDTDLASRVQLEVELKRAIRTSAIVPYFQPLVDLSSRRLRGFEVLCRWNHPARGLIPPSEFIPLAETSGLIDSLTMALLQKACLKARSLPSNLSIAINVAPQQIQDEWLAEKILAVLTKTGFAPERLNVELTESAFVSDMDSAKRVITSLKKLGIKVALDDFGTGYSSLCYLSELPFDEIKIDRFFVKTLHDRPESAKIIAAIIGLGKSLGVPTIAEGVETERDAEVLREMGCTCAQGYLYSEPVPAADLLALVRQLSSEQGLRAAG